MAKNTRIRVVAGKALSEHPKPDYIKKRLRHLYHQHGDDFLEYLIEMVSHETLVLLNLKAGEAARAAKQWPSPPAVGTKCGHKNKIYA
jgi:hypothetical protein